MAIGSAAFGETLRSAVVSLVGIAVFLVVAVVVWLLTWLVWLVWLVKVGCRRGVCCWRKDRGVGLVGGRV